MGASADVPGVRACGVLRLVSAKACDEALQYDDAPDHAIGRAGRELGMVLCGRDDVGRNLRARPFAMLGSGCWKRGLEGYGRGSSKDHGSAERTFPGRGTDLAGGCEWGGVGLNGQAGDFAVPMWAVVEASVLRWDTWSRGVEVRCDSGSGGADRDRVATIPAGPELLQC